MSVVLTDGDMARAIKRISHEIIEHNRGAENILLLGIPTRGVILARRIAQSIADIEKHPVKHGSLDVTMFRDDLRIKAPRTLYPTEIPGDGINQRDVILIDDVFFSGRTVRAALDALSELGRAKTVQLAVLVDRGHRELPIRADYVGKNLPTNRQERVSVHFSEIDGVDEVQIGKSL